MKVLFVCLGNICRSPTAHGVFEEKVRERGLASQVYTDSCGTGAWHVGESPDPRASQHAAKRGYDLSHLRARQVSPDDFDTFDYVLAMDNANLKDLQSIIPAGARTQPVLFLSYGAFSEQEVPDPYYGGEQGFEHVLDLVESACDGLLDEIQSRL
ncbi:protein-tyrosine-phosphatase [Oleiphilus sp. HI0009]|nr:protein-tyrosine-phosphatase [Oleiphilus sp. HI0009]KZX83590.1 protein-tyrosine-phosphatase [Oleiphilus sp. HI0009]MCH2157191.1 low molecular weight phosphotyrosine protein phosphatase [Oleiphilaceae bacterium]